MIRDAQIERISFDVWFFRQCKDGIRFVKFDRVSNCALEDRPRGNVTSNENFVHGKKDASDVCRYGREPQDFFEVMVTCVDHVEKR